MFTSTTMFLSFSGLRRDVTPLDKVEIPVSVHKSLSDKAVEEHSLHKISSKTDHVPFLYSSNILLEKMHKNGTLLKKLYSKFQEIDLILIPSL